MVRFSDAFLDELRARTSISEVVGARVAWDARRSNGARGDYWACCPFHGEKTPSFHVIERTGRFHCFGCGVKGGAIDFLMQLDRMSFPEAVEELAQRAGMPLPSVDPAAAERAKAAKSLAEVMEVAVRIFRDALGGPDGAEARAYLARRGVAPEMIARFELGLATGPRDGLIRRLRGEGVPLDALIAVDLAARPKDNPSGAPYDRFQNRLMFPIRDGRGRCVAFGGRDLSGKARAKYMNSSETTLFQKRKTLYNLAPAREAVGRGADAPPPLIVAEGYMDVIALAQAGFPAAVAPLGTAVGPEQLETLWRLSAAPVMALDGDKAGQGAADRAADLALPLIGPERSLAFALMPAGQDPDDFLRADPPQGGAEAMRALIGGAQPLVDRLFQREAARTPLETPEQREGLLARLGALAAGIAHEGLKRAYGRELRGRAFALFASTRGRPAGRGGGPEVRGGPRPETRAAADLGPETREGVLVLALLEHPEALAALEDQLVDLNLSSQRLDTFLSALLSAFALSPGPNSLDKERLAYAVDAALGDGSCAALRAAHGRRLPASCGPAAPQDAATAAAAGMVDLLRAEAARRTEAASFALAAQDDDAERCRTRLWEALGAQGEALSAIASGAGAASGGGAGHADEESALSAQLKAFVEDKPWIRRGKQRRH